jgi:hypothetical protein
MSRFMFQKQQFVNVAEVPCREAAQSNFCCSECAGRVSVTIRSPRRRIAERSEALAPVRQCMQLGQI